MKPVKTLPELREACAYIMAGAINGDVKESEGRMALNAATRIIEAYQAEIRGRALAFASKQVFDNSAPLDKPMMKAQTVVDEKAGQQKLSE